MATPADALRARLFAPMTSPMAGLRLVRRVSAAGGLAAIATLTLFDERASANVPGTVAVALLAVAAVLLLVETRAAPAQAAAVDAVASGVRGRRLALAVVALAPALAVQTWFGFDGAVAGGDIVPPNGTAWLSHIFDAWQWTGSGLGAPGTPFQLPWGAVLWVVTHAGGSAALAQRLWLTILFSGAALAAYGLLRALRIAAAGAAAGALVYAFNPYVVSVVGTNAVYLAAMVLLPGLPAVAIAAGSGGLARRRAVVLYVLAAPLLGYAYENPPLLAPIAACCLLAPAATWCRFGRESGRRSAAFLAYAGVALAAASAYWWVPALAQLRVVAGGRLSALASWTWTESRATVGNDFWLNPHWGWSHPEYFPYAHLYSSAWLVVAKYALPFVAFAGLLLARANERARSRLLAVAALVALFVVLAATGTRAPGSAIFNLLYALPLGWLLREPGRFLLLVGLLYGSMIALLGDRLAIRWRSKGAASRRRRELTVAGLAAAAILATAFPLYDGVLVPGPRDGFPSTHVTMPSDWARMADVANRSPASGALLILPADDFYQMPYTWYYGSDGFIADLFRHAVVPSRQGYYQVSGELLHAIAIAQRSLAERDWTTARQVLAAIGTPLLLVRGDIDTHFPKHREIVSPRALAVALHAMPGAMLIHREGPLELWWVGLPEPRSFATVSSSAPDLRSLRALPDGTELVTHPPVAGHLIVEQLSSLAAWRRRRGRLVMTAPIERGWSWRAVSVVGPVRRELLGLRPAAVAPGITGTAIPAPNPTVHLVAKLGAPLLGNGDFDAGSWGPVGDCHDVTPGALASGLLRSRLVRGVGVVPGRALALSARGGDSACVSRALLWRHGPILLSASVRGVSGSAPRLCLWEEGPATCAKAAVLPARSGWSEYQAVVEPDAGTRSLRLFLYADAPPGGGSTVAEYTHVSAYGLRSVIAPVLIGIPRSQSGAERLVAAPSAFDASWHAAGQHVMVDGLRNGWLAGPGTHVAPRYAPSSLISVAQVVSATIALLALAAAVLSAAAVAAIRRRVSLWRRGPAAPEGTRA